MLQINTADSIADIKSNSSHAYILAGPAGSGKKTLAREIAGIKLALNDRRSLDSYPYFMFIEAASSTIGIDQVREILHFLSLRTSGREDIRRVLIIADAHNMTREAQNALLKPLEEPPEDTVLILTTASALGLLPTIRSRAQVINVMPCSKKESVKFFEGKGFETQKIEKAHALSGGYAGLMYALLTEQDNHPLFRHIEKSKTLLTSSVYERLISIEDLLKNKDDLPDLLRSLKLVCRAALASASASSAGRASKLVRSLSMILQAENALLGNANSKLVLTNLFLHL